MRIVITLRFIFQDTRRPSSVLKDEPQSYYDAHNFDGTYQGEVPMYQAVAQSLNLPAVWLLHEIGLQKGYG